jgi:hypothetical protein
VAFALRRRKKMRTGVRGDSGDVWKRMGGGEAAA